MAPETTPTSDAREGFTDFFRRYTKTWVHAVATAGLTAFGTLTFVHRWFVLLAIASYAVPPIVLYATRDRRAGSGVPGDRGADAAPSGPTEGSTGRSGAGTAAAPSSGAADGPGTRSGPHDSPSTPDRASSGTDEEAAAADEGGRDARWRTADSPTDATLSDAAIVAGGAYAVGEGGVVLAAAGDGWRIRLEDGPGADATDLHGADVTADGDVVWVAGDGGAVGRLETSTGRHADHSAPRDITDNWVAVAVAGSADDETVLLANGSGEILRGRYRDGQIAWEAPVKPGGGSSLAGVDAVDASVAYCCDTNDGVYATTDGGRAFEPIGDVGAGGTLTDVAAVHRDDCLASADDGVVYRYDGATWTPERVGDGPLTAIDGDDDRIVVVDGAGAVHERAGDGADWERTLTGASGPLLGVAVAGDRAVAVGDGGAVVERR